MTTLPIHPCCGKRHPQPWAHHERGEIICGGCGEGHKPSEYGSGFCKRCVIQLNYQVSASTTDEGSESIFVHIVRNSQ